VLLLAGLHNCANPIFNNLFEDDRSSNNRGKTVKLNVEALKEVVNDYEDRLCTPVFIGIRTGYMQNESEVKKLAESEAFEVTTPIDAARRMVSRLPDQETNLTEV
jgi:CRISPR-associated protein Cst2